jgi:hypothetical protein
MHDPDSDLRSCSACSTPATGTEASTCAASSRLRWLRRTDGTSLARPSAPSAPWLSASLRDQSASGAQLPTAIPRVSIIKEAQQFNGDAAVDDGSRGPASEVEILSRIADNFEHAPLAGFVSEGTAACGLLSEAADAALRQAVLSGMPVVKVGRGNNLTASKARLLLMACLMSSAACRSHETRA